MSDIQMEQYRQCWENYRQLWLLYWRYPTYAVAIAGGLFALAFIRLWGEDTWLQAAFTLLVGSILTLNLAFVACKHRFFGQIWQTTLTNMEETLPGLIKRVQRTSIPNKDIENPTRELWYPKTPRIWQRFSGESSLILVLIVTFLVELAFSIIAFMNFFGCSLLSSIT